MGAVDQVSSRNKKNSIRPWEREKLPRTNMLRILCGLGGERLELQVQENPYYYLVQGTDGDDQPRRWSAPASACDSQAKNIEWGKKMSDTLNNQATFPG